MPAGLGVVVGQFFLLWVALGLSVGLAVANLFEFGVVGSLPVPPSIVGAVVACLLSAAVVAVAYERSDAVLTWGILSFVASLVLDRLVGRASDPVARSVGTTYAVLDVALVWVAAFLLAYAVTCGGGLAGRRRPSRDAEP